VVSFNAEVAFKIASFTSFDDYVYMQEGFGYLAAVEPDELRNYIYDFYYPATTEPLEESTLMYFTAKIHMLKGGIHYYSRLCPTGLSSQQCAVTVHDLSDPAFLTEVRAFKGELSRYYSNYEIYQWTPLSSCTKGPVNNQETYHCKLHIVGYNPKGGSECQWIMSLYSRQSNIELKEGHPFQDKVLESAYNYYQFTPPQANFTALKVFLTVLTGEVSLLTSQKYPRPEFLFGKVDDTL
jgi:hypothetical protein